MDGNGRWAKKRGNKRIFGHKNGVKSVRETVEAAGEVGVKYLTLYAFSTENWKRPKNETDALMTLLISSIKDETDKLIKNNVRLNVIGNFNQLPKKVQLKLKELINKTKDNTGLTVILALSYGSRDEITQTFKDIAMDVKSGKLNIEDINEEYISNNLFTSQIPDPELLIRTSGEYRISNFLMWQIAYCELYFAEILWPDFRKKDLYEAIYSFQKRERRFGKIN